MKIIIDADLEYMIDIEKSNKGQMRACLRSLDEKVKVQGFTLKEIFEMLNMHIEREDAQKIGDALTLNHNKSGNIYIGDQNLHENYLKTNIGVVSSPRKLVSLAEDYLSHYENV